MSSSDWTAQAKTTTRSISDDIADGQSRESGGRDGRLTFWFHLSFMALRRMRKGSLVVTMPDGRRHEFQGDMDGPSAELRLHDEKVARHLILGGDLAFAESYLDGAWDSPDITALIQLCAENWDDIAARVDGNILARTARRLAHFKRRNSKNGSRRNISHHYDIGNAFYARWLDPSMTYSSAIFEGQDEELEAAQMRKYRRLADMLNLEAGQTVLEIGCGWGGFARLLAKEYGVKVVGLTLSTEQRAEAMRRIAADGLSDQIEIRLQDYRDVTGSFDRIASIEMLEAVGESYWPTYFATLRDRLVPGGRAAIQVITIDDRRYEGYRVNPDFIQKYIFPGGMLPSPAKLTSSFAEAGLETIADDGFALDYARTLALWRQRFLEAWPAITEQGFDERFRRMWEYYLCYCEGGFRAGHIDVRQIILRHA